MRLPVAALDDDGSGEAGAHVDGAQCPSTCILALQRLRLSRRKRHAEALERYLQAEPSRLYVSFFTRPALKESLCPHCFRQGAQFREFLLRKIVLGDFVARKIRANRFHINSDLAAGSEGEQGKPTRVRNVETNRLGGILKAQSRLPELSVTESQRGWGTA